MELSKILTPTEQFDQAEITKIAESMREQGLIHEIIIRPAKKPKDAFEIVIGRRRFLAAQMLGWVEIPVRIETLSDYDAIERSIHENLKRANLPWHEEVVLVERLHELRQQQHGASTTGRPKNLAEKGWGVRDTAVELGKSLGGVAQDIMLAKEVMVDPALSKIKDKKTAIRVIRTRVKQRIAEDEAGLPTSIDSDEVLCGAAADLLKQLVPDCTFDACITDPPWLNFANDTGGLTRDSDTLPVFKEVYRTLKFGSLLYMFVGTDDWYFYRQELPKFGFEVSKTPLIWHKINGMSRMGVRPWEYGRNFELILLAAKGAAVLTSQTQMESVISHDVVPTKLLIHPNEKPAGLIKKLVGDCTYPGAFILDPFSGSGAHLEAIKAEKRKFLGIERDEGRCAKIRQRLGL